METADLPDNTLILDSLIHSVLVSTKSLLFAMQTMLHCNYWLKVVANYLKPLLAHCLVIPLLMNS